MCKFKYIFLFIILAGMYYNPANAQKRLKYKDVFETVLTGNREQSYSLLLEFQRQDPEFPNTYFQLGLIAQYWAKEYDPLTDMENVEFFIYNTRLYFGLAKGKLAADDKDVRRNKRFYQTAKITPDNENFDYPDVVKFIDNQIKDIEEYDKNAHTIVRYYNASVSHYNNCIALFMDINKQNNKLKDIYLSANKDLLDKAKLLASSYDSTLYYFQEYKTAIKSYPLKKYNQNMKIFPIETFRLEGLTSSNFLLDEIPVWDYGTWVKNLMQVINKDVNDVRIDIAQAHKAMNTQHDQLLNATTFSDSNTGYKLDDKLIFKIEKFDYKSIISALFQYKQSKIEFLVKLRKTINNPKDTNLISFAKRARYYQDLIQQKNTTDSLNKILAYLNTPKSILKYDDFFQTNYKGHEGLKNYCEKEKQNCTNLLNNAYANLKTFLFNDLRPFSNDSAKINYKNLELPVYQQYVNYIDAGKNFVTVSSDIDAAGNIYISGYQKSGAYAQAFFAKLDKNKNIIWHKSTNITNNVYDCGILIKATENGCFVLINSQTNKENKNTLLRLDLEGKQITKTDLDVILMPRFINYDEINENVIIAYKGKEFDPTLDEEGKLVVQKVSFTAPEKNWKTEFTLNGTLADIVKMDTTYFVFTNFSKATLPDNSQIVSKAGNSKILTNACLTVLTQEGKQVKNLPYYSAQPFFILKAVKLNSNTINLLGCKASLSSLHKPGTDKNGDLFYSIINLKGDETFKN